MIVCIYLSSPALLHLDLIGSDAQSFILSRKGGYHLVNNEFVYRSNMKRQGRSKNIVYWECVRNRDLRCRARLKSVGDSLYLANRNSKPKQKKTKS